MKNLQLLVEESLVNEATNFKPKYQTQDWDKALKALTGGNKYSNYSQLCGLENVSEGAGWNAVGVDEWLEEVYDSDFDKKGEYRDILADIATFHWNYYDKSSWDYGDSQEEIYRFKKYEIIDGNGDNYGIEAENWYYGLSYNGPKNLTKYAKVIASYGDCSYTDNLNELEEYFG